MNKLLLLFITATTIMSYGAEKTSIEILSL